MAQRIMIESEKARPVDGAARDASDVVTPPARALIDELTRRFAARRDALLAVRGTRPLSFRADAFAESARGGAWRVAAIPADLSERIVEITGPADKKMIVNALTSGASVFMADFEDSCAPTWMNLMDGQRALARAVRRDLDFTDEKSGKRYALTGTDKLAVLMARPRGLHLDEAHVIVDGRRAPASFVDAALYLVHNAKELLARGSGPYLYLPKLEAYEEAALWHDVLHTIEDAIGIAQDSVKVTVLIETLPAAFQMEEILFALKERCVGLNCGRWDYIFSAIKRGRLATPDRAQVTMEQPFLSAYTQLLVKTCHRRGAFAMGGMSAFIPRKDDAAANDKALAKVRADKEREVTSGHDGTWVAHPGLVALARSVFVAHLGDQPNQLDVKRDDVRADAAALLQAPTGTRTEAGLRHNVRVGVHYLAAWLGGNGCVPIDGLMEDAATAEISRTQLWQWLHTNADVDGAPLTLERITRAATEECAHLADLPAIGPHVARARELFLAQVARSTLDEFLTVPAYEILVNDNGQI